MLTLALWYQVNQLFQSKLFLGQTRYANAIVVIRCVAIRSDLAESFDRRTRIIQVHDRATCWIAINQ